MVEAKLREQLGRCVPAGTITTRIGVQRDKAGRIKRIGREATLVVRHQTVRLEAPKNHPEEAEALTVQVVYLLEEYPPAGIARVDWMLLTSEPVASFADSCLFAGWYQFRWVVEEWHRVLKEGCGLEEAAGRDSGSVAASLGGVVGGRGKDAQTQGSGARKREPGCPEASVERRCGVDSSGGAVGRMCSGKDHAGDVLADDREERGIHRTKKRWQAGLEGDLAWLVRHQPDGQLRRNAPDPKASTELWVRVRSWTGCFG